jgi:hypothetical protein
MVFELTPGMVGKSLFFSLGALILSFAFAIYNLYLQIKQAKVNKNTERMLEVLIEIRDELKGGIS